MNACFNHLLYTPQSGVLAKQAVQETQHTSMVVSMTDKQFVQHSVIPGKDSNHVHDEVSFGQVPLPYSSPPNPVQVAKELNPTPQREPSSSKVVWWT